MKPDEPQTEDQPPAERESRGPIRRHALPVALGVVLGLGLLALLRFLGVGQVLVPDPAVETTDRSDSASSDSASSDSARSDFAITDLELREVVDRAMREEMARGASPPGPAAGGARPASEPWKAPDDAAPCDGRVECLLVRSGSDWEVRLAAPEEERVGSRIAATLTSSGAGLVTFFLVETDGSVLLIYPTPGGDVPVAAEGVDLRLPRPEDRIRLSWGAPGDRDLVAILSTDPFVPPPGETAAGVLTVYEAETGAADEFFAALRDRIAADRSAGAASWAMDAASVDVLPEDVLPEDPP